MKIGAVLEDLRLCLKIGAVLANVRLIGAVLAKIGAVRQSADNSVRK